MVPGVPRPGAAAAGVPAGADGARAVPGPRRAGRRLLRHGPRRRARSCAAGSRTASTLPPERRPRALCRAAVDTLVDLHGVDPDAAGLADLGRGRGLRAPAGRRLDRALRQGAHPERPVVPARHPLARRERAGRRRAVRHPQRLPPRQPRAGAGRPVARGRRPRLGAGDDRRPADGPRRRAGVLGAGGRRAPGAARPPPAVAPAGHADPPGDRGALRRAHRAGRRRVDVLRGVRAVPARRHRAADLLPVPPPADDEPGVPAPLGDGGLPRPAVPPGDPGSRGPGRVG